MATFKECSKRETSRYLEILAGNANNKLTSFEEFAKPYLLSSKTFMQKFDAPDAPQSVIISISRWPNHGLCITMSYLSANNEHILELIWNPPKDNVLKIMTARQKDNAERDNVIICEQPCDGYLYDTGEKYIIDWMLLIKPLKTSYRLMVSYKTHATQTEPVTQSLQDLTSDDHTALGNLFDVNESSSATARHWFSRPDRGLESMFFDCGEALLPHLLLKITFNVRSRIFVKEKTPYILSSNLLKEINVVSNDDFVKYFLDTAINFVPKVHREVLRFNRNKVSSVKSSYVTKNELDKSIGKKYKQRGYMYFNTSPSIDGTFVASKPAEEIIVLTESP